MENQPLASLEARNIGYWRNLSFTDCVFRSLGNRRRWRLFKRTASANLLGNDGDGCKSQPIDVLTIAEWMESQGLCRTAIGDISGLLLEIRLAPQTCWPMRESFEIGRVVVN